MSSEIALHICRAGIKTPPEVEAEIVRLYQAGVFRREIVKAVGCGKNTISVVLNKHGVSLRGNHRPDVPTERIETVKRLYLEGLSTTEIGKKLDTTRSVIAGIIHRNGFTRSETVNRANVVRARKQNGLKASSAENLAKGRVVGIKRSRADGPNQPSAYKIGVTGHVYTMPPTVELPKFTGATPSSRPKPWLERLFGECTWPVSGEGVGTFSCCAQVVAGTSWCRDHNRTGRNGWGSKGYMATPDAFAAEILRRCA